ncbi:unnamed protein product [Fusarium venenatum]|uniref:Uncharacterized protein n=1 Tax=Fusarium venenatum TaxID=56646 RepID=A0A2L2T8V4_9HYPO|nr:uncharacterized protein FVRRES_03826 [Fusarium venenatum]CEI67314.1 unnamed protein product [Fusarium venenatum]
MVQLPARLLSPPDLLGVMASDLSCNDLLGMLRYLKSTAREISLPVDSSIIRLKVVDEHQTVNKDESEAKEHG